MTCGDCAYWQEGRCTEGDDVSAPSHCFYWDEGRCTMFREPFGRIEGQVIAGRIDGRSQVDITGDTSTLISVPGEIGGTACGPGLGPIEER